ncbi:hypothetical protein FRC00_001089 [Tulasnella sp. 408]|nr:hypothetical protein FRC00_001089 [Tulasnella sp. 408]
MAAQFTEKLTKVPAIPKEFGEDGGKFYKYYDELADELDGDMVTSLKAQLDGILIFAGLFAGVNSAFLAFTLPQMSADPADDTNALLFQILLRGNRTIGSTFRFLHAPTGALPINILFAMSLTLALLASFLAVLGQQWLVYYRKRSGGGVEHQRWEQLRRYLGAKRWRLELVLDDLLPSILQRYAEATGQLKVVALKRVLCTSEDPSALAYAAVNAHSLTDRDLLRQILDDDELKNRFERLATTASEMDPSMIQIQTFAASLLHILLLAGNVEDFIPSDSLELGLEAKLRIIASKFIIYGDLRGYVMLDYTIHVFQLICFGDTDMSPELNPEGFEGRAGLDGDPRSVSYVWLLALVIKTLHDRSNVSNMEGRSDSLRLEDFRNFLALYQEV